MPDAPDAVRDHLALALVPGLGPKLTAALIERFGSAAAALRATAAQLTEVPHIGERTAADLAAALRTVNVEPELRLMEKHGTHAVALGLEGYPAPLARVPAPPPLLYLRGEWLAADANAVGIVGSRSCTSYGMKVAAQLARELARAGFTVVSGLARGIDGAAHRGALEAGGRTVAALAGGLSKIYPPEHADLAAQIADGRGCLVTETPMAVAPQPGMFPARNRVISGLSRAVIVIEANARSGALITARHAAEQGREVYAVPGRVDDTASAGCLELIRAGARLVRSADDVLEDLKGIAGSVEPVPASGRREPAVRGAAGEQPAHAGRSPEPPPPPPPQLDATQQRVFDALATRKHADELTRELGVPVAELSRVLMQLEMKKVVRRVPGNFYERR
ncbi:dna protecting protein : DNA protecting protein DprA OS=Singulisphaera acidiphila (strain ATCC BAA-1392 / DSM 18658 / VKM B-2454 / MOB10) GN=Sinac_6401 PE=4 SV=1: HHH_5: DNA_processg_A [Gemmataceae bacterium]|nr:dna protecting protein : DNA protecting protein DprA OS=Singulisphaera acidiphila (strain ATCC BAA-1392 / DSM 18658 / VKM B-2454 / MOB10) GN=Sinac_6401 PE=4 SV=1: HHH_5: DNA_processg_A [Gemmataceae bacterium]VTT97826.1 dna protecting protein : DNA protecting protein DprA OS=Singulisphaera acidiphila (strain ATCC BAA-1392 / DSM 18658 / VKM B-2454 / MOB10) GN=Sinac_6401 PE=4 SV=1: HHH_5: DNA_processg_A [Gemmataceae bacterium]